MRVAAGLSISVGHSHPLHSMKFDQHRTRRDRPRATHLIKKFPALPDIASPYPPIRPSPAPTATPRPHSPRFLAERYRRGGAHQEPARSLRPAGAKNGGSEERRGPRRGPARTEPEDGTSATEDGSEVRRGRARGWEGRNRRAAGTGTTGRSRGGSGSIGGARERGTNSTAFRAKTGKHGRQIRTKNAYFCRLADMVPWPGPLVSLPPA